MTHRIDYRNRLPLNVKYDVVEQVIPEFFRSAYPNLVKFLEYYYDYMESVDNQRNAFSYVIQTLYQLRDIEGNELTDLDQLLYEIGYNVQRKEFDQNVDPRHLAKLIAYFYRAKGREISIEGLFNAFFGEDVEIYYPKRDIFILNKSKLGPEYLKYIRDDKRYQILSILLKSPIPIKKWKKIVKKYAHPAGFYLAGDVLLDGVATISPTAPTVVLDSDANTVALEAEATASFTSLTSVTGIVPDSPDSDAWAERIVLNQLISPLSATTISGINHQYDTLKEFLSVQSPSFDEDSTATNRSIDFSNTIETTDNFAFDYWDSDQNVFQYQDSN